MLRLLPKRDSREIKTEAKRTKITLGETFNAGPNGRAV